MILSMITHWIRTIVSLSRTIIIILHKLYTLHRMRALGSLVVSLARLSPTRLEYDIKTIIL